MRPRDLEYVVRLHEWSHALLHLGTQQQQAQGAQNEAVPRKLLGSATRWFKGLGTPLSERLPQLLTHYSLQSLLRDATLPEAQGAIERIQTGFSKLTARAPDEYRIDQYAGVPKSRVVASIDLLKGGGLVGTEAWEAVIVW